MTKEEMLAKINFVYINSFEAMYFAKITPKIWGLWLDSFETYEQLRKIYTFIFGSKINFRYHIQELSCTIDSLFDNGTNLTRQEKIDRWGHFLIMTPTAFKAMELRSNILDIKTVWKKRPPKLRKGMT